VVRRDQRPGSSEQIRNSDLCLENSAPSPTCCPYEIENKGAVEYGKVKSIKGKELEG
jgi:hypothetical protein